MAMKTSEVSSRFLLLKPGRVQITVICFLVFETAFKQTPFSRSSSQNVGFPRLWSIKAIAAKKFNLGLADGEETKLPEPRRLSLSSKLI